MKKAITFISVFIVLFTVTSCSPTVTYIRAPGDKDADIFKEIIEISAEGTDEVVVYSYDTIYDVAVSIMKYNMETDEYSVEKTLYETPVLNSLNALKISLNLSSEMPYVAVKYTRDNGETREQYIYKTEKDGKYWLLERE